MTLLLSVPMSLTTPGTPCKWNHTAGIPLRLAYFTERNVNFIQLSRVT